MKVSSEDAAKKYPKKVPVGAAQAQWESLQPRKNRGDAETSGNGKRKAEEAMTNVPTPTAPTIGGVRPRPNFRQEPIEIDSSSDSEAIELPVSNGKGKGAAVVGGGATNSESGNGGFGGDGVADADKPLPSTEDTESETTGESRPSSSGGAARGGFMAKRGRRHA